MKIDRTYTPLFDFQILFDTDFGMMSLIAAEMQDIDVFNHEWIKAHHTNRLMIKALYERTDKNPLIQAAVINDKKELDELYNSFINDEEYYSKVVDRSMPTEIYNLLERCFIMGDIYPYILYNNDIELDHIKNDPITNQVKEENLIKLQDLIMNPKKYRGMFSQMYCKYNEGMVVDALASLNSYAKTFYIADYNFNNYEGKKGTINTSGEGLTMAIIDDRCDIRSIDIYNRYLLEVGVDETPANNDEEEDDDGYKRWFT